MHVKQNECRQGSVLGLVYWSKHTAHVSSCSSNSFLIQLRDDDGLAIIIVLKKIRVCQFEHQFMNIVILIVYTQDKSIFLICKLTNSVAYM